MRTTTPSSLSKPPPEPVHHQGRTPSECLLLTADARLTEGYCRQRMVEQREENKKIARLAEVVFCVFNFSLGGAGVSYAVFPDCRAISLFVFSTRHRRLCR